MECLRIKMFVAMIAAAIHFYSLTILFVIGPAIVFYIIVFTRYWQIACIYLIWIWIIDRHTPLNGGRTVQWVREWKLFKYARKHYPVTLKAVAGFKLDPKRNYMFACFPHGIMGTSFAISLASNSCKVDDLIPSHKIHILTLNFNFWVPVYREYLLSFGACSVAADSINYLLSYSGGGKIASIVIGGAAEASYANPGVYKIVLKKRQGFVKIALRNGSPLVPVFSFGEVDLFRQVQIPEGSMLNCFQKWIKSKTRMFLPLIVGRGFCERHIGLIPFSSPVNVIIGHPIEVEKNVNPTQEEIDALHLKFMESITELFEEHKYKFIKNADKTTLSIV